jgi:hypothetical protein
LVRQRAEEFAFSVLLGATQRARRIAVMMVVRPEVIQNAHLFN